jgi:hypothetical protein
MLPVAVKEPVAGSYNSAVFVGVHGESSIGNPPVIKTRPSSSKVAVWPSRGMVIEPVAANIPMVCAGILSVHVSTAPDSKALWEAAREAGPV